MVKGLVLAGAIPIAFGHAGPSPAPTPRPYWEWMSGTVFALGPGWTVDVLHGGAVIVITPLRRMTVELTAEQRSTLTGLAADLPKTQRSYQWGRAASEDPLFTLRLDDGARKTTYLVLGVDTPPGEVADLRAVARVAVFLRSLIPSNEDLVEPARWFAPVLATP
jgi:hypothetical protein